MGALAYEALTLSNSYGWIILCMLLCVILYVAILYAIPSERKIIASGYRMVLGKLRRS